MPLHFPVLMANATEKKMDTGYKATLEPSRVYQIITRNGTVLVLPQMQERTLHR